MISRRKFISSSCAAVTLAAMKGFSTERKEISSPKIAKFWHLEGENIQCELCPHRCVLPEGKTGNCRNRIHKNKQLIALGYAKPCAVHVDPIEKKPFYHMLPSSRTYSLGVAGCNLRCKNCQNYTISQRSPLETDNIFLPPAKVVEEAINSNCPVIAYTYTEPTVWIEYVLDTATIAKKAGLRNVLVTSGYINPTPFDELTKVVDAARIDLKSFSDKIYQNLNAGKLQPVLDTILLAKKRGLWVEIINLVIPGWNDTDELFKSLCRWVKSYTGNDTPVHFSRFYPMYQLSHIYPTPISTLKRATEIGKAEGLKYVYIGNVGDIGSTTFCPTCQKPLIVRSGYVILENSIRDGKCKYCGEKIAGVWG
ncbi:MAG: AmmeMemoRadiSam system radical SAM enzyme [Chitinispirillaceae bacterium]|nr:AmmeMemoRadiSam system radical SAM enzyme [Chitinispirillaceae bacterium]